MVLSAPHCTFGPKNWIGVIGAPISTRAAPSGKVREHPAFHRSGSGWYYQYHLVSSPGSNVLGPGRFEKWGLTG